MERFFGVGIVRTTFFCLNVLTRRFDCWVRLTWVATLLLGTVPSPEPLLAPGRMRSFVCLCVGPVKILIMEVQECRLGPRKAVGIFRVRRQSCCSRNTSRE